MSECRRIAIANSKGGVGKTTTVLECAAHARALKKRVLVVDMDPQADATKMLLGSQLGAEEKHIFHLLIGSAKIEDVVRNATESWNGIHVLPSDLSLTTLPEHISGTLGYEKKLSKIIDQIEKLYDLILIDTGPQTTVLTQLALRAADYLFIPTDTSLYSETAIERTLAIKNQLQVEGGHKLNLIGIAFAAHHKPNAKANKEAERSISNTHGHKILSVILPHCTKVLEAQRIETKSGLIAVPAMSIISEDHPLFLNYRKITKTMLGDRK